MSAVRKTLLRRIAETKAEFDRLFRDIADRVAHCEHLRTQLLSLRSQLAAIDMARKSRSGLRLARPDDADEVVDLGAACRCELGQGFRSSRV